MSVDSGTAETEGPGAAPARPQLRRGVTSEDRAGEMKRWRSRSRRIGVYRAALPWIMIAIVAAVIGWVGVRAFLDSKEVAAPAATELRMTAPRFYGRDEAGRSFQLTAESASRTAGDSTEVTLINPGMELDVGSGMPMSVKGGRGVYNEEARMLTLEGGVQLQDGRGFDLRSPEAVVDTHEGVVRGEKGVTGTGPLGQVSASSYAISQGGERAVFTGGVRSHIVPE